MKNFSKIARALIMCASIAAPLAAHADWPDKPIRLVIPYAPGGGADTLARTIAMPLGEKLGQTVVVENRPGAGAVIAESLVANAQPDGYTVLYDTFTYSVNSSLRKLSFDPAKDLSPVAMVATVPMIFVVNPKSEAKTLGQFLDLAKQNKDGMSYASFGIGSPAHLAAEMLAQEANVSMLHVPYKGGSPALLDVVGGLVDSYFASAPSGQPYVVNGQLRALAVSSAQRVNSMPDVPTVAESGFPGFEVLDWHGVFLPSGTPADIQQKLADAMQYAVSTPEVVERFESLGVVPSDYTSDQFKDFVSNQMSTWSKLIKDRNITLE